MNYHEWCVQVISLSKMGTVRVRQEVGIRYALQPDCVEEERHI